MPGVGCGCGVWTGSPSPWTPAALGPVLWVGPASAAGRVTYAAQPSQTDLDMETAGTAAYSPYGGATVAKDAAIFHSGTQSLKTSHNLKYAGINRATVAVGHRLRLTGYARGDGALHPAVLLDGSAEDWTGTNAAQWQAVTAERTIGNATIYLVQGAAVAGSVWWDDLTLTNISAASLTPAIGAALAQAGPTAMPWVGSLGLMFDGDVMPWTGAAALVKCLHDGTAGSLGIAYRPTTLKAENRIVATAATAVGNVGVCVSCTNANTIRVRVMNGGAAYDYDSGDVACPIAINTTYTMVLRVAAGAGGVSLRVNGTEIISGALTAPSAANPTTGLMLGGDAVGAATNITGYLGQAVVVQRAITVAECAQYEAYVAKEGL